MVLDPVEFLQRDRRLFIDTNIFMDTDQRRAGGLKRLFERGQSAILTNGNPIVVPTKVVNELTKQSLLDPSIETEKRAEAIKKAGAALTFLESASSVGLIRKDLGDDTNPYADDLFIQLFERFAGTYEMCLLTYDITIKLRIRLLAHRLGKRLIVGALTKDGDIEVEADGVLFERGSRKFDRHSARIAYGNGDFKDESEVATLRPLLDEFRVAFRLSAPAPNTGGRVQKPAAETGTPAGPVAATSFASNSKIKPRDVLLEFQALPTEGDQVSWESASNRGRLRLGQRLGEGGEGSVYQGDRGTVVKIFDHDHVTQHRKEKIELLVGRDLQVRGICIPSALVRNRHGEFVGYVMPMASGREFQRTIFNKRRFEKEFPTWKKVDLVDICISFLEKVQYLHSMNVILGDINPKNLMIDDQKNVSIIDADSWQLEGYPCPVGTPMFTSPAMLGKSYADDLRTMEDELFAVATMLFMIIMTGQFPYIRTGTDGDMVQLIKEGNFAFQYEKYNNRDQPNGDWKYMWSHIHKPIKDLFWHTFHKEGKRYKKRPSATEWLEAFKAYRDYLGDERLNFDPMSNDVYPIRSKAFRPDTRIHDCSICGRENAIAEIWDDDINEYHVPRQCNKCRYSQPPRPVAAPRKSSAPAMVKCKDCLKDFPKTQMTYGRCPACMTKANSLDLSRRCVECRQPFITHDHIGWFTSRNLEIPKSHAGIKQMCPPASVPLRGPASTPASRHAPKGIWARLKSWFG